jgi:glycosyltransferase involved in cell wall biosynthesis
MESSIVPKFTHRLAIKYAKQIIVHGEELKREMVREYNKALDDINVLNRGVNSIYRRFIKKEIEEENSTVLFFGRIWGYKGLQYLIEAEPKITREIPDLKIIIAGRGEDVNKIYGDKMINKDKYIIHNNHIPNKMVAELFQKASVVVLPYTDASQSGVVPLAYAFGKPVVVTNVGSLPEAVDDGETGYIVPPRNPEQLAKAVIDLLKDRKKRKRMGENAFRKTQEELAWKNIALKTKEVYEKAISIQAKFKQNDK